VMLFCGERKQIEYDDLERTLNAAREHAIWELTNAIGARDASAAMAALGRLLDEGKHPLQISFSLQLQFRQLLMVKEMLGRRVPHDKAAEIARLGRWKDRIFRQARLFSAAELRGIYRRLFELEDSIKSAGVDERFLLEYIIYRVCRSGRSDSAADRSA
jgi:DNA polymerase-3 subunit delta